MGGHWVGRLPLADRAVDVDEREGNGLVVNIEGREMGFFSILGIAIAAFAGVAVLAGGAMFLLAYLARLGWELAGG